tara:strand:+ start:20060 stop:20287 length:228 start_codon:yes stop_codon:yes gene_type:complete
LAIEEPTIGRQIIKLVNDSTSLKQTSEIDIYLKNFVSKRKRNLYGFKKRKFLLEWNTNRPERQSKRKLLIKFEGL